MKILNLILRLIWGLHFLIFGINKLYIFSPIQGSNSFARQVIDSFYQTGYLMETVGLFQVITGLLIILNRYFPLAILVAFPISFNILLYTIFTSNFAPQSLLPALLVFFANVYFLYLNRNTFSPILKLKQTT